MKSVTEKFLSIFLLGIFQNFQFLVVLNYKNYGYKAENYFRNYSSRNFRIWNIQQILPNFLVKDI